LYPVPRSGRPLWRSISRIWSRGRKRWIWSRKLYKLTDSFPKRQIYSLTDQIRRAAVSIPSNIAEGQAHYNHREFRHFLRHSAGSLAELETQLLLAERLGYTDRPSTEALLKRVHEVGKIRNGLIKSLPE